jgi:hypothetical protein
VKEIILGRIKFYVLPGDLFVPDVPDGFVDLWPLGYGKVSDTDGCAVMSLSLRPANCQIAAPVDLQEATDLIEEAADPYEAPDEVWLKPSAAAAKATAPSAPPASSGGPRSEVGGPEAFVPGLACTSDLLDQGILPFRVNFGNGMLLDWLPVRAELSLRNGLRPPSLKKEHSIDNLCLGFDYEKMGYDKPTQLYSPSEAFTVEHITLAKSIKAGLVRLQSAIMDRNPRPGGPTVMAGILVAMEWAHHMSEKVLVWGPLMAFYISAGWRFKFDACRSQCPRTDGGASGQAIAIAHHCDHCHLRRPSSSSLSPPSWPSVPSSS